MLISRSQFDDGRLVLVRLINAKSVSTENGERVFIYQYDHMINNKEIIQVLL